MLDFGRMGPTVGPDARPYSYKVHQLGRVFEDYLAAQGERVIIALMEPVEEKTNIMIAGSFNPAILSPQWIGKYILDPPITGDFPVMVLAPINAPVPATRFKAPGLDYSPSFQGVTFFLEDADSAARQRVCDMAARILKLLPHTPVTGVGFNFGFRDANPAVEQLRLLSISPSFTEALGDGAEVVGRNWLNLASWGNALVTLQTGIRGSEFSVDLNFHYPVKDASGAEAVLGAAAVFEKHRAAADRIVMAGNTNVQTD
jgi:hypothetical protein